MPPATGLNFYRKRQNLEALAQERPQSLQSVYSIVKEVVAAIEERLVNLESSYYGPNGSPESEIKKWQLPLQLVIRPARFSGLICKSQLEDIYDRHINYLDPLTVDEDSLTLVQSMVAKAIKTIREGFSEIMVYVRKLQEYMSKYCVTFSGAEGDRYLETATNYEKQKRDLEKAIELNMKEYTSKYCVTFSGAEGDRYLETATNYEKQKRDLEKNIPLLAEKFEKDCLRIDHFDLSVKEMAERHRIDHSPIVLAFTAATHSIRNANKGLLMWVHADSHYAQYLHYDIAELEKKKDAQCKLYRECQVKANTAEFGVKTLKKKIGECNEQLKRLRPREKNIKMEEKKLRAENKDVLVDLDIKEYRRLEMKLNGSLTDRDGQERFERLRSEILDIKKRKPAIDRRITDLERQQTWISERYSYTETKEEELERATNDMRQARRVARKEEVELERQDACLAKLKEIHLLKTSPETLKKIFHNMPIIGRYAQPAKKKKDRLDKLCKIVTSEIDGDWSRLYRNLPFYPHRGEETVASDIDDIMTRFLRNTDEQASHSLSRWRRMHTRACVDDVIHALNAIKRKDIVEKFDRTGAQHKTQNFFPKSHRMVHFPKIDPSTRKKQHYLYF